MEWKNPLQEPKNPWVQKTKDLAMEWKNPLHKQNNPSIRWQEITV